jgi:hypothetical protein
MKPVDLGDGLKLLTGAAPDWTRRQLSRGHEGKVCDR